MSKAHREYDLLKTTKEAQQMTNKRDNADGPEFDDIPMDWGQAEQMQADAAEEAEVHRLKREKLWTDAHPHVSHQEALRSLRQLSTNISQPTIGDSNMVTSKSAPTSTTTEKENKMTITPSPTANKAAWANTWTQAKGRVWLSNDETDALDPAFTPSEAEPVNEDEQRINLFAERFLASFPKTKAIRNMRPEPANALFAPWYIQADIAAGGSRIVHGVDGPITVHSPSSLLNATDERPVPDAQELTDQYASSVFWDAINPGYKILSQMSDERRADVMVPDADISCALPFMEGFTRGGVGSGLEVNGPDGKGGYTKTGFKMYMLQTSADVAESATVHFILVGHRPNKKAGRSFRDFRTIEQVAQQEWAPTLLAIRTHIVLKADLDAAIIAPLVAMTAERYSAPDASTQTFNRENREAAKLARMQGLPNDQSVD